MLFVEARFFVFLAVVFGVHWILRRNRWRKLWLLGASYVFYGAWDWRFLSLILISTLVDYGVGLRLAAPGSRRRMWVTTSVVVNLGLLAVFKYYGFFVGSAAELMRWFGFEPNLGTLSIVLPVGISFYTFQTLSYSLDVYSGRLQPTRKLGDLALFVAFFPQLVAGPIVRAKDFLPQLEGTRRFAAIDVRAALILFFVGFVKKACISDNLAPVVDDYFASPEAYNALGAWAATAFYTVQIYCDFSGYSDMAIACAALFGYRLCLNFSHPYFAGDISEFWRRWHISLSSWLRDYVYIPLGGNRGSALRVYLNTTVTFLLCGLWHGAAWNFVLWGAFHGVMILLGREWRMRLAGNPLRRATALLGPWMTLYSVAVGWILFRAVGWADTHTALRAFVLFDAPGEKDFGTPFLWIIPLLLFVHLVSYRRWGAGWWRPIPAWGFALAYAGLWTLALALMATDAAPFIYFQF